MELLEKPKHIKIYSTNYLPSVIFVCSLFECAIKLLHLLLLHSNRNTKWFVLFAQSVLNYRYPKAAIILFVTFRLENALKNTMSIGNCLNKIILMQTYKQFYLKIELDKGQTYSWAYLNT